MAKTTPTSDVVDSDDEHYAIPQVHTNLNTIMNMVYINMNIYINMHHVPVHVRIVIYKTTDKDKDANLDIT
jgi:hypothetical protein